MTVAHRAPALFLWCCLSLLVLMLAACTSRNGDSVSPTDSDTPGAVNTSINSLVHLPGTVHSILFPSRQLVFISYCFECLEGQTAVSNSSVSDIPIELYFLVDSAAEIWDQVAPFPARLYLSDLHFGDSLVLTGQYLFPSIYVSRIDRLTRAPVDTVVTTTQVLAVYEKEEIFETTAFSQVSVTPQTSFFNVAGSIFYPAKFLDIRVGDTIEAEGTVEIGFELRARSIRVRRAYFPIEISAAVLNIDTTARLISVEGHTGTIEISSTTRVLARVRPHQNGSLVPDFPGSERHYEVIPFSALKPGFMVTVKGVLRPDLPLSATEIILHDGFEELLDYPIVNRDLNLSRM